MDSVTVNDIFRAYGAAFRKKYPEISLLEKKVMRSIEICRTEKMGGRIEVCNDCGHEIILYNSCRNRHCPQCQNMKKEKWIHAQNNFLVPVQVLKMRFRSLFLKKLKKIYKDGSLFLNGTEYQHPVCFQKLIDSLFSTDWVVYLKESFQKNESVIEYLARYTHRIAISNYRIISLGNDVVAFKYRDYKNNNTEQIKRMNVFSFMWSFMLHVLPFRFVRIRYYGMLAHRNKKKNIDACRDYYNLEKLPEKEPLDWRDILLNKTGRDCLQCPNCKNGRLVVKEILNPIRYRAPPIPTRSVNNFVSVL